MPPQDPTSPQPGYQPPVPPTQTPQPAAPNPDFSAAPAPAPEVPTFQPPAPAPAPQPEVSAFQPPAPAPSPDFSAPPAQPMEAPAPAPTPATFAPTEPKPADPFAPAAPAPQAFQPPAPQGNLPQPLVPGQPAPTAPAQPFGQQPAVGAPVDAGLGQFGAPAGPYAEAKKKSKLPFMIAGGVGALLLLGGIGFGVMTVLGSKISLETYDGAKISFKYPKGYTKSEDTGLVTFKEPGDEKTASGVMAQVYDLPSYVDQSAIDTGLDTIKDKLEEEINTELDNGNKVVEFKAEDSTFDGKKAVRYYARIEKDGKAVGETRGLLGQNDHGYFIIQVLAHSSDKGVKKAENTILDSVKTKASSNESPVE